MPLIPGPKPRSDIHTPYAGPAAGSGRSCGKAGYTCLFESGGFHATVPHSEELQYYINGRALSTSSGVLIFKRRQGEPFRFPDAFFGLLK